MNKIYYQLLLSARLIFTSKLINVLEREQLYQKREGENKPGCHYKADYKYST